MSLVAHYCDRGSVEAVSDSCRGARAHIFVFDCDPPFKMSWVGAAVHFGT